MLDPAEQGRQKGKGKKSRAERRKNYKKSKSDDQASESSRKPFMWLHPPKSIELSMNDNLYVLTDKN